ncbi:MAG TPA: NAD(P)H-hydrate epimerase, partial [Candidatus Udaeobacter sp.]
MNLPILTSAQMRAAEEAAFARGVEVEALMDKAGAGVAQMVTRFFHKPGRCIVFAGKGNNAGDALVAAECLRRLGWKIEVRLAFRESDCSELMCKKLQSLRRRPPEILNARPSRGGTDLGVIFVELMTEAAEELSAAQEAIASEAYIATATPAIILDGLLGLGARPPLRDPIRAACRCINQLRKNKGAYVFAVDLPTGLDGDSGKADRDCIVADFTATIGFAKPGLVADEALNFVGRLGVVQ